MTTNKKSILAQNFNAANIKPDNKIVFNGGKTVKKNFHVYGMTCGNCVKHVQKALLSQKGVSSADVNLSDKTAIIEYSPSLTNPEQLKKAVADAGYELITEDSEEDNIAEQCSIDSESLITKSEKRTKPTESSDIKTDFPVTGMTCASCVSHVEKALTKQQGVSYVSVNLATNIAHVEYSPTLTSPKELKKAVEDAGYDLIIDSDERSDAEQEQQKNIIRLKNNTITALILSLPLVVIAMGFHTIPYADYIMWALATPVVFIMGKTFFVNAWKQFRHHSSNMDTLVALSTGIAYLFSVFNTVYPSFWTNKGMMPHVYFEVSAVVIAFVLLGRYLEARAKGGTADAIKQLIGMQPNTATVVRDNKFVEISIKDIALNDELIAKPGEKIAVDGEVISGNSFVDESTINGEPLAIEKMKGSQVFAGTINQTGSIHYIARKICKDTLLSQIVKMVQDAQGSKAPIQKTVDKIASVFVPVIFIVSVITFIAWFVFGGQNYLPQALMSMVTVLIIACPCALGLATPTAIMVGIGRGATTGILIKDAQALETAKKLTAIVLDKTGTITEGKPHVTGIKWFIDPESEPKDLLYSIESYSEHPLGKAIIDCLKDEAKLLNNITINVIAGQGIIGEYENEKYYIGNAKLLEANQVFISEDIRSQIKQMSKEANTLVFYASEKQFIAAIAIADTIKSSSKDAITKLKADGLKVYMLTGDNKESAQMIAEKVGIDYIKSDMMPDEKSSYIKTLQQQGEVVAMVGDGINDSAALATADLSIAMGKGSDIAMNVAQITIISSDLSKIDQAIRLSKATVMTIRQNLFWAFIYNLIGVPIAAGIFYPINGFLLNPMIAGAAMALSSVSVVTNSLLLKKKKL